MCHRQTSVQLIMLFMHSFRKLHNNRAMSSKNLLQFSRVNLMPTCRKSVQRRQSYQLTIWTATTQTRNTTQRWY